MTVTKEEIRHIAHLARLELTDKEEDKYSKEISAILEFVDQLKTADTKDIEPLYQTTGQVNVIREDTNPYGIEESKINEILSQAPRREKNLVKVNPILDKSR